MSLAQERRGCEAKLRKKRIEFGEMMEVQRKEGCLRKKAWTPEELKAWSDLDSLEQDLHRIKSQQLRLEKRRTSKRWAKCQRL